MRFLGDETEDGLEFPISVRDKSREEVPMLQVETDTGLLLEERSFSRLSKPSPHVFLFL